MSMARYNITPVAGALSDWHRLNMLLPVMLRSLCDSWALHDSAGHNKCNAGRVIGDAG